eukprot:m.299538 g.299538  ORF g.299538 m.299538 type:complete len:112 (-) comp110662_c0_seq1:3-338(-)
MLACWAADPKNRPTLKSLSELLRSFTVSESPAHDTMLGGDECNGVDYDVPADLHRALNGIGAIQRNTPISRAQYHEPLQDVTTNASESTPSMTPGKEGDDAFQSTEQYLEL